MPTKELPAKSKMFSRFEALLPGVTKSFPKPLHRIPLLPAQFAFATPSPRIEDSFAGFHLAFPFRASVSASVRVAPSKRSTTSPKRVYEARKDETVPLGANESGIPRGLYFFF